MLRASVRAGEASEEGRAVGRIYSSRSAVQRDNDAGIACAIFSDCVFLETKMNAHGRHRNVEGASSLIVSEGAERRAMLRTKSLRDPASSTQDLGMH